MSIIKYRSPNTLIPNNVGGGIDFSKWVINRKKIEMLKNKCVDLLKYFDQYEEFEQLPITLFFSKIIPKTQRIKSIFGDLKNPPMQIGSNYVFGKNNEIFKINIIYSCSKAVLQNTIFNITNLENKLDNNFQETINGINSETINIDVKNERIKVFLQNETNLETMDKNILNDLNYIDDINIISSEKYIISPIISIYDIIDFNKFLILLERDGIYINQDNIVADEFINIDVEDLNKIISKYPFIISQSFQNITITYDDVNENTINEIDIINSEDNNTFIGVIDSGCVLNKGWKTYHKQGGNYIPESLERNLNHGTSVSSLIIGNDYINDDFIDYLGEYNIKSFEVMPKGPINTFFLMKNIEEIIKENYINIKIWNMSIGGQREDDWNLSVFGKLLDILQHRYDVQFIVSAGNFGEGRLTSPADSLTAISVGALYQKNNGQFVRSQYSSTGNVFSIFDKPSTYEMGNDISAIDSSDKKIFVLDSKGNKIIEEGTSFAAPLVTRKIAFLYKKYKIKLQTARATLNYLSKIKENGKADLKKLEKSGDIFLLIEGEIKKGEKLDIPIKLPYNIENNSTNFSINCSIAYNVANTKNLGSEYSCVDISIKLMSHTIDKNNKLIKRNIITPKKTITEGQNADEQALRNYFKKYNPNTVLIDDNFERNKPKKINNFQKFTLEVQRIDLFNHIDKPIIYGALIHLQEIEERSLINFEELNQENILEIINSETIDQDIEID